MTDAEQRSAQVSSPLKNPKVRKWLVIVGLALSVLLCIWAVRWFLYSRYLESTDDAYIKADAVSVAPTVSGYVQNLFVSENQTVKAGQPLVQVDPRSYQAALAQVKANLDARRADVEKAEAEIDQQHSAIGQAMAQLAASSASRRFAQTQIERYGPLAESGADTREKIDQVRSSLDQASATEAANTASVQSAKHQLATLIAAKAQAEAQLEAAEANLKQSQLDLGHTVIRSTIQGRVGDRTVRVGQFVQPGTRMMTIVPTDNLYITANFKETQIGRMRRGQPVDIEADAIPAAHIRGKVESFAPGTGAQFALLPPENATGNFTKIVQRVPVRISVEASAAARQILLPGLSVTVTVDTRMAEEVQ